jgi:hypothetical protein
MDIEMEKMKGSVNNTFEQVGIRKHKSGKMSADQIMELVNREDFRSATSGNAPLSKAPAPF